MTCGPGRFGRHGPCRRGFTLLESLMAAGILLTVVTAVSLTVSAGQRNSYEAHARIAGTLAAEELMSQLVNERYDDLPTWNGFTEAVGTMADVNGDPFPSSFDMVGRHVSVTTDLLTLSDVNVRVRGRTVRVQAFDSDLAVLADLERFVPEPAEDSIPEDGGGEILR